MKYRYLVISLVSVSLILLMVGGTRPVVEVKGFVQIYVTKLSKPLYAGTNRMMRTSTLLADIKDLARENSRLKSENEIMKSQVVELKELKNRISSLEKELQLNALNPDKKYVIAAVVGRTPTSFRDSITIDKGERDGIKIDQPVMSNGFLIGRVMTTFQESSQVELISSHRFMVPAVLQESRTLGLVRGGVKGIQIEQLPIDSTLKVGETVVTSGLAGKLPAGLPLGTIKTILSKPADIFQTATIDSPIDAHRLEIVLVLIQ